VLRNFIRKQKDRFLPPIETKLDRELPGPFHRTKSIFIHIPKAAGTSVSTALYGYSVGHATISQLYEKDYKAARAYFKFTFVRDPLDRLLSTFRFFNSGGMHIRDREFAEQHVRDLDFTTFVRKLYESAEIREHLLLLPQMHFIATPDKRVLVNFIGRFENLDKDFAHVTKTIGLDAKLPHKNASRMADIAIDDETRKLVKDIYEIDYTWLSY
jgi:hypothetical protein